MTRLGLDPDTVPWATARLVEQRNINRWLPLALARLYCLVAAYGMKTPPKISDVLRSWGLSFDADCLDDLTRELDEMETKRSLEMFFGKGN